MVEKEEIRLPCDFFSMIGYEGVEAVNELRGNDRIVYSRIVVDHIEENSRVEIDEIGEFVASHFEILSHSALVAVEK